MDAALCLLASLKQSLLCNCCNFPSNTNVESYLDVNLSNDISGVAGQPVGFDQMRLREQLPLNQIWAALTSQVKRIKAVFNKPNRVVCAPW